MFGNGGFSRGLGKSQSLEVWKFGMFQTLEVWKFGMLQTLEVWKFGVWKFGNSWYSPNLQTSKLPNSQSSNLSNFPNFQTSKLQKVPNFQTSKRLGSCLIWALVAGPPIQYLAKHKIETLLKLILSGVEQGMWNTAGLKHSRTSGLDPSKSTFD